MVKLMKRLPAFEVIGSRERAVAIVEIPDDMGDREKEIAKAIRARQKNIVTVLKKESGRRGIFRKRKYKRLLGRSIDVKHKEFGVLYELNPEFVYFSPRDGTERERILKFIKPGQVVMVFFAGVGPYPIIIAKKTKASRVIGIEINPQAVKYFKRNVKLNKVRNVDVVYGDVKKKAKHYRNCDHVFMPMLEGCWNYLTDAKKCLRLGGFIHFYCIVENGDFDAWIKRIEKKLGNIKVVDKQKVHAYAPGKAKSRISFQVI